MNNVIKGFAGLGLTALGGYIGYHFNSQKTQHILNVVAKTFAGRQRIASPIC